MRAPMVTPRELVPWTDDGIADPNVGTAGTRRPRRRWRRRALWVALAVVIVIALFLFGGGWYFSGVIESDALAVDPPAQLERDLMVRAVDGSRLTLAELPGEDVARLDDPMLLGLEWDGGRGVLSTSVERVDGGVVRALEVVEGTAPSVGDEAAVDVEYYAGDPQRALGLDFTEVTIDAELGPLDAWYVPATSSTWAILVHGKGGTRAQMLRALPPVHGAGLPALVIDYRNDPGAPEDPSGRYGYGATEWLDLEAAVQAALDRGAHDVVLVGWSMGGAITAAFLEQSELADRVVGIVLDAPMLDLGATVDDEAADRSLPLVGLPIPGALTWTAKQLAAVRYDLDWNALDYVDDTAWLDVPTLVFHGTVDDTVPVAIARDLARAEPELVELRETGSASHLESWNRDRASYEDALRSFLRTWGGEDDGGSPDG